MFSVFLHCQNITADLHGANWPDLETELFVFPITLVGQTLFSDFVIFSCSIVISLFSHLKYLQLDQSNQRHRLRHRETISDTAE